MRLCRGQIDGPYSTMRRLILRKLGEIIPVLLLVSLGAALLSELISGSPARYILGEFATEERVAALDHELGYDKPFFPRYWDWLTHALRGDLGNSAVAARPVTSQLKDALPATLEIAVLALVGALLVSVPAAIIAAARARRRTDQLVSSAAATFQAMPSFVTAVFAGQVFVIWLGWFPSFGWVPITESVSQNLKYAALPALVLVCNITPMMFRVLRADMLSVLQQDFVTFARARGLSDRYILVRHVLRPASLSLLTVTGLMFGYLIGGSIVIETFFSLPGLGSLVARSITARDIVVVQGVVLYVAVVYLVLNLIVDMLQLAINPQARPRK